MNVNGARAKLRRAQEHLDTLERSISSFLETHQYGAVVEHASGDVYTVRVADAPLIPAENWALLVGDCVHNVRSSLDYLAWELAGADRADTQTQFPIFDTETGWQKHAERRVGRMQPAAQAFIQQLQPYLTPNPRRDVLTGIRTLDDADKHKLLTVVAARPDKISVEWQMPGKADNPPREPRIDLALDGEIYEGATLASVLVPDAPPGLEMTAAFTPAIAFGESLGFGARMHVVNSLKLFIEVAARIGAGIEKRFP